MGYKVDFDELDTMYYSLGNQNGIWLEELEKLQADFVHLKNSSNMSGNAANSIGAYIGGVHTILNGLLSQLISLHSANCLLYKNAYQSEIDTDLHARIDETEINDIKDTIERNRVSAVDTDGELSYTLNSIKDIFYVSYQDVSEVDNIHQSVKNMITSLDDNIKSLEDYHYNNDFINTQELIDDITAFIREQLGKTRSYKTSFRPEQLAESQTFKKLYDSYMNVEREMEAKADDITTAFDNEKERIADLEAEYNERQKNAEMINWIVTGVCVVGSIAAIAATGGAATPLVVGAVSAVSGAVMAGTTNLTGQSVQHGNLIENANEIAWSSFGKDVVVAGVTGFVTGYVGASMGSILTSKLQATKAGALLHSTNSVVRVGTGAAIGSAAEVGSGIVTRGVGTMIVTGGDVEEAVDQAFDGKNIAVDATLGGLSGGGEQISAIHKAQQVADSKALNYNSKYDPLEAGERKGLQNLKQTKNHGVDFSDSDYILRTESGEPIQVKIKATGKRTSDYKAAEKILKEDYGIDIDFKSMRTGKGKTHVWHHLDDYNVATNETTLQFIDIDAHHAIENHSGSANQYYQAHGTGYGKHSATENIEGINMLDYTSPGLNTIDTMAEHAVNTQAIKLPENKFNEDTITYHPFGMDHAPEMGASEMTVSEAIAALNNTGYSGRRCPVKGSPMGSVGNYIHSAMDNIGSSTATAEIQSVLNKISNATESAMAI